MSAGGSFMYDKFLIIGVKLVEKKYTEFISSLKTHGNVTKSIGIFSARSK